jgi:hypothetical protein
MKRNSNPNHHSSKLVCWVGGWFTLTKNNNNGGTHTCNTFVHTSKQASKQASQPASQQSSHTFGRLPPVIKCFYFFQKIFDPALTIKKIL